MVQPAVCPDRTREQKRVQVGDIARAHGDALRATCALSFEQQLVLRALERCRTAALGGHLYTCDSCGHEVPMYNSCRNRHCPTCQSHEQNKWLERRRDTILPVPYFHLVFTLPSELRPVVAMNRERLFALMFEAASKTVLILSRDQKRLGGTPALTMVLHTWTRDLTFHPHVHAIVSAGALSTEGVWVASRTGYLFPVKVMRRMFRGRFVTELRRVANTLALRDDELDALLDLLMSKDWTVYAKPVLGHPHQVLDYLGRYTYRIAIGHERLLSVTEEEVQFRYRDYRDGGKHKVMSLDGTEFIRRFLRHVLPRGFMRVRHFGFLGNRVRRQYLERIRNLLPQRRKPTANVMPRMVAERPCPRCQRGVLRYVAAAPIAIVDSS